MTGKPLVIKSGRYGPYVTDGETNASLRKGDEVESITLQRAAELLADRRAAGPATTTRRVPGLFQIVSGTLSPERPYPLDLPDTVAQ